MTTEHNNSQSPAIIGGTADSETNQRPPTHNANADAKPSTAIAGQVAGLLCGAVILCLMYGGKEGIITAAIAAPFAILLFLFQSRRK